MLSRRLPHPFIPLSAFWVWRVTFLELHQIALAKGCLAPVTLAVTVSPQSEPTQHTKKVLLIFPHHTSWWDGWLSSFKCVLLYSTTSEFEITALLYSFCKLKAIIWRNSKLYFSQRRYYVLCFFFKCTLSFPFKSTAPPDNTPTCLISAHCWCCFVPAGECCNEPSSRSPAAPSHLCVGGCSRKTQYPSDFNHCTFFIKRADVRPHGPYGEIWCSHIFKK